MSPRRHPPLIGFVLIALALLAALLAVTPAGAAPDDPTPTPLPAGGRLRLAAGVGAGAGGLAAPAATVVPPGLPAPSPDPRLPGVAGTPTPASGAGTPAAAPTRRTVVPQTPASAPAGTLAGVRYDAARDQVGARAKVLGYRDAQMKNGVPEQDANRIALAHYKWDCQDGGTCDRTGLDLSAVDINDAHANFGFNPECEEWGTTFKPHWGQWDPPANQPACDGAAGAAAGEAGAGSVTAVAGGQGDAGCGITNLGGCIARALGGIDWGELVGKLLRAVYDLLWTNGLEQVAGELAALLLATPQVTRGGGSMQNIQGLVDVFLAAGRALALLILVVQLLELMLGTGGAPGALLGRTVVVVAALGAYKYLWGWGITGANTLVGEILTAGGDRTTPTFALTLSAGAAPVLILVALVAEIVLITLLALKFVGVALLLVLYAAGPLILPFAIHERGGRLVGPWLEHLAKLLLWPVCWALLFRVFGAISGGLEWAPAALTGGVPNVLDNVFGAGVSLALLAVMAATPWLLHTRVTPGAVVAATRRTATRVATAVPALATGGASATFLGGAMSGFEHRRSQGARPAAVTIHERGSTPILHVHQGRDRAAGAAAGD